MEDNYYAKAEYLFCQYYALLLHHGMSLLGNLPDAEDCVMDTYLTVIELMKNSPNRLEAAESTRTKNFLISITRNCAKNRLRQRKQIHRHPEGYLKCNDDYSMPECFIMVEKRQIVKNLLKCLSVRYRTIIMLRYQQGFEASSIARIVGGTRQNVYTMLHRAKKKMKKVSI